MPPVCDYSKWLIDTIQSIGFGVADNPTSYTDLLSWQQFSGINFTPWEAETLRELSLIYISGLHKYEKDCTPPFVSESMKIKRNASIANIRRKMLKQAG